MLLIDIRIAYRIRPDLQQAQKKFKTIPQGEVNCKGPNSGGFLRLMATYSELLLDPRWQEKRLKVMERDKFTCQYCNIKGNTLNVHHLYYQAGLRPWDYADHLLITLCQPCHKKEETLKKQEYAEGKFLLRLWADEILGEVMMQVWESPNKYEAIQRIKEAIKLPPNGTSSTVL